MKFSRFPRLLGLVFLTLISPLVLNAQHNTDAYALHLNSGIVHPTPNLLNKDYSTIEVVAANNRSYYYLQFQDVPNAEQRKAIEATDVHFLGYLPHRTYIVSLPVTYDLAQLEPYQARSLIKIEAAYKMSVPLAERPLPDWAVIGDEIRVNIKYYADLNLDLVLEGLERRDYRVISRYDYGHQITVQIPIDEIERLAIEPYIAYVEAIDPPAELENYTGRTNHRSNAIAADYPMGRHYDGTGVHVAMGDDGVIGPHIDYQGRNDQQNVSSNNGDHGDHVAGIIMAAGNLDPKGRGNAYGADLYVYSVWDAVNNSPTTFNTDSIRITSTSYGNGCNAGYTNFAQNADEMIRQTPQLMHVFSAGNSGSSDCGYGAGSGWGNVTGGVKIGKNVTAVANLGATDQLAGSSSRGPASDGRIKPDMAAVGSSVYSTIDVNTYGVKSGTSMAAPGVSGVYAQLYHAYRVLNGTDPESGLMKALLMNGAEDLGNPGPDFKFGFGRINARRAVETLEQNRYQTFTLDQGNQVNTTINVPAGTAQFRVMIYWTDWEGSTQASMALVNDLDMVVTDPTATTYEPWVLDHTPNAANLDLPATRGVDHLNNVEQVTIDNPTPGTYSIDIDGFNIPQGPQTFFVVWEVISEDVYLTYPIGGESFVPGESELIRWDAYGNTGATSLEYSLDNGSTWNTMVTGLAGDARNYSWSVPTATTGEAMVRITRGTHTDSVEAPFSIARLPLNLQVDWVCPDSLQLSWSAASGATSYEISQLGNKYMDSIGTTTGTTFVVVGTDPFQEDWFSVKSLGPNNAIGRRAYAIEKPQGVFGCVIADDASVSQIITPSSGTYQGCNDFDTIPVTIELHNHGTASLTNIPVYYNMVGAGGGTESGMYTGTLLPDSSDTYTFAVPVLFNGNSPYTITAWTEYPTDPNTTNDTTGISVQTLSAATVETLPWSDDFESNNNCGTQSNCESTNCSINNGWVNDSNISSDDIDWREDKDGTPSDGTGPDVDHNPGTSNGIYLYTEASGDCNGQEARLTSPCFDLSGTSAPQFEFWYHMSGNSMGELHVDVLNGLQWELDVIEPEFGNQGNTWRQIIVDLSDYAGQTVNVRIRGITGDDFASDMAIDDVSVYDAVGMDDYANLNNAFVVYPNPNDGHFTIDWQKLDANIESIEIYSVVGELVTTLSVDNQSKQVNVDLDGVSQGIYFVKLQDGNVQYTTKLTVQ